MMLLTFCIHENRTDGAAEKHTPIIHNIKTMMTVGPTVINKDNASFKATKTAQERLEEDGKDLKEST